MTLHVDLAVLRKNPASSPLFLRPRQRNDKPHVDLQCSCYIVTDYLVLCANQGTFVNYCCHNVQLRCLMISQTLYLYAYIFFCAAVVIVVRAL